MSFQIVSEHAHRSGIGLQKSRGQLQSQRFSRPAFADQNFRFPGGDRKRQSVQHIACVETDAYIFEGENRFAGDVRGYRGVVAVIIGEAAARAVIKRSGELVRVNYRWKRLPCAESIAKLNLEKCPPRNSISLVRKKFVIRMNTEEATTACVVARPTPCVPPFTFRP